MSFDFNPSSILSFIKARYNNTGDILIAEQLFTLNTPRVHTVPVEPASTPTELEAQMKSAKYYADEAQAKAFILAADPTGITRTPQAENWVKAASEVMDGMLHPRIFEARRLAGEPAGDCEDFAVRILCSVFKSGWAVRGFLGNAHWVASDGVKHGHSIAVWMDGQGFWWAGQNWHARPVAVDPKNWIPMEIKHTCYLAQEVPVISVSDADTVMFGRQKVVVG